MCELTLGGVDLLEFVLSHKWLSQICLEAMDKSLLIMVSAVLARPCVSMDCFFTHANQVKGPPNNIICYPDSSAFSAQPLDDCIAFVRRDAYSQQIAALNFIFECPLQDRQTTWTVKIRTQGNSHSSLKGVQSTCPRSLMDLANRLGETQCLSKCDQGTNVGQQPKVSRLPRVSFSLCLLACRTGRMRHSPRN